MPGPSRRTVLQGLLAAYGLGGANLVRAEAVERPDVVGVGTGVAEKKTSRNSVRRSWLERLRWTFSPM